MLRAMATYRRFNAWLHGDSKTSVVAITTSERRYTSRLLKAVNTWCNTSSTWRFLFRRAIAGEELPLLMPAATGICGSVNCSKVAVQQNSVAR